MEGEVAQGREKRIESVVRGEAGGDED